MATPKDVLHLMKESGAEIVDFRFCDLPGPDAALLGPGRPSSTRDCFEDGIGFDGSSIRGFQEIQESDMLLVPDPDTAYMDPFTQHRTLNINCFVKDPVTGEMYCRDPRYVAKKAELYLQADRHRATSATGARSREFYIFDSIRFDQNQHEGYYHIDADRGRLELRRRAGRPEPRLPAALQGGLLPAPADGPVPGPAERDGR